MNPLLRTALEAASAASAVHRRHAGRVRVDEAVDKGTSDFVSEVDLEAQEEALRVIRERHPEHGILAEEEDGGGSPEDPSSPLWVVDPLDGTTNFLHGHPMYCASVAVVVDGRIEAGAVECSVTGERWWAVRGGGAFKDGRRIAVSASTDPSRALIGTGFPFKALDRMPEYLAQLDRVLRSTAGVRRGGSAAMDLCHLAEGVYQGFWELYLLPWDVAAGIVILREAGGVVTRIDGSEPGLEEGSILAACSKPMWEAVGGMVGG